MKKKIIIFGNGEIAKLAHYYFRSDSVYEVVGFTVDKINCASNSFNNLPLIPFETVEEKFPVKEHLLQEKTIQGKKEKSPTSHGLII